MPPLSRLLLSLLPRDTDDASGAHCWAMRRGLGGRTDDDTHDDELLHIIGNRHSDMGSGLGNDCIAVPCNEAITT